MLNNVTKTEIGNIEFSLLYFIFVIPITCPVYLMQSYCFTWFNKCFASYICIIIGISLAPFLIFIWNITCLVKVYLHIDILLLLS